MQDLHSQPSCKPISKATLYDSSCLNYTYNGEVLAPLKHLIYWGMTKTSPPQLFPCLRLGGLLSRPLKCVVHTISHFRMHLYVHPYYYFVHTAPQIWPILRVQTLLQSTSIMSSSWWHRLNKKFDHLLPRAHAQGVSNQFNCLLLLLLLLLSSSTQKWPDLDI